MYFKYRVNRPTIATLMLIRIRTEYAGDYILSKLQGFRGAPCISNNRPNCTKWAIKNIYKKKLVSGISDKE